MGSADSGPMLLWQVRIIHAGHLPAVLSPTIVFVRPNETLEALCTRLTAADKLQGRLVDEVQVRRPAGGSAGGRGRGRGRGGGGN